jgi:signal transduction histidine kinase
MHEYQNAVTGRSYQCRENRILWADGRLVRIAVAVDITDLKEMARIKDEMISAVSHEMKTPLTAIQGYTEFLLGNDVGEMRLREYLGVIHKETERLIGLVENFLEMQLLKTGQRLGNLAPLKLQPMVEETVALFACIAGDHQLSVELPTDLPPVLSDEPYIRRVLTNLLSNAIKFSPKGGKVVVGARPEAETVTLWVKDEGIGIAPEVLDKIFDKFYQVDSGDHRGYGGTGLGLALVREIVTANGGRVWAESVPGRGSTFYVSLPVVHET